MSFINEFKIELIGKCYGIRGIIYLWGSGSGLYAPRVDFPITLQLVFYSLFIVQLNTSVLFNTSVMEPMICEIFFPPKCMPRFKEDKEPVLVYLSPVSLLSLPEKELSKGDEYIKNSNWPYNGKSVDAGHDDSSHDSESFDSEQQSESVPYATVVFAGPYRCQPVPPPVYLRSESTQPLLGEEEPSSPRPYEKMTTQVNLPDVDHFSTFRKNLGAGEKSSLWVDFPMLRSLEINSKT